jgi:hypothetical protein
MQHEEVGNPLSRIWLAKMPCAFKQFPRRVRVNATANGPQSRIAGRKLLLPRAFLVTMQTQLLAPFMAVDFGLAALFE